MFGFSEINTSQQIYYYGMVAGKLSDPPSVVQSQPRNALHSFPVKKYFNLFWKGSFCLQRNHPLNIRQVYIISFSLFSSIRPPGIILGQLFPSSLSEFQSQDV